MTLHAVTSATLAATVVAASIYTSQAGLVYPRAITGPFKLNEVTNTSMACGEDLGQAEVKFFNPGDTIEAKYHRDAEDDYGGVMRGFIRWALAPIDSIEHYPSASDFDNNVLQYTCNGDDCEWYEGDDVERVPFYKLDEKFEMTKKTNEIYNGWVCTARLKLPEDLPLGLYKLQFTRFGAVKAVVELADKDDSTYILEEPVEAVPANPHRTCTYVSVIEKDQDTSGSGVPSNLSAIPSKLIELIHAFNASSSGSYEAGTTQGNPGTEEEDEEDIILDGGTKKPWGCWGCSEDGDNSSGNSNDNDVDAGDGDSTDTNGGFFDKDTSTSSNHSDSDTAKQGDSHLGSGSSLIESGSSSNIDSASEHSNNRNSEDTVNSGSGSGTDVDVRTDDGNDNRNAGETTVRKLQDGSNPGADTKLDLGCPKTVSEGVNSGLPGQCFYAFTNKIEVPRDSSVSETVKLRSLFFYGANGKTPEKPFKVGIPEAQSPECS